MLPADKLVARIAASGIDPAKKVTASCGSGVTACVIGLALYLMSEASKGAPPQFLSTHPSGKTRIQDIEDNLPKVMPLYERTKAARGN